ncbi:MAG: NfeD family protein [Dehalococcoidales bacterium]|jgi:membrane protein implicated in regulation of membrane protease activity|nr:NfeD family protein [Dehalococcoidales bacterium]
MIGDAGILFANSWLWLIFIGTGLFLALLELLVGIDTGLDLVFTGSAFIIGGLITFPFHSWILTLIVTLIICLAYIFLGRRYLHRLTVSPLSRTNIDAIIGKTGIVLKGIDSAQAGLVRVGNEEWRAISEQKLEKETPVVVTAVQGVTLIVKKLVKEEI